MPGTVGHWPPRLDLSGTRPGRGGGPGGGGREPEGYHHDEVGPGPAVARNAGPVTVRDAAVTVTVMVTRDLTVAPARPPAPGPAPPAAQPPPQRPASHSHGERRAFASATARVSGLGPA